LIGRRKVLLLNLFGCFIYYFTSGFLIYFNIHPIYLLVCSTAWDIFGGLSVIIIVMMASVAASSSGSDQLKKIIITDSSLMLPSVIMTPVGWWIKKYGFDYIYWVVFGASILVVITSIFSFIFYKNQELPEESQTNSDYFRFGLTKSDIKDYSKLVMTHDQGSPRYALTFSGGPARDPALTSAGRAVARDFFFV